MAFYMGKLYQLAEQKEQHKRELAQVANAASKAGKACSFLRTSVQVTASAAPLLAAGAATLTVGWLGYRLKTERDELRRHLAMAEEQLRHLTADRDGAQQALRASQALDRTRDDKALRLAQAVRGDRLAMRSENDALTGHLRTARASLEKAVADGARHATLTQDYQVELKHVREARLKESLHKEEALTQLEEKRQECKRLRQKSRINDSKMSRYFREHGMRWKTDAHERCADLTRQLDAARVQLYDVNDATQNHDAIQRDLSKRLEESDLRWEKEQERCREIDQARRSAEDRAARAESDAAAWKEQVAEMTVVRSRERSEAACVLERLADADAQLRTRTIEGASYRERLAAVTAELQKEQSKMIASSEQLTIVEGNLTSEAAARASYEKRLEDMMLSIRALSDVSARRGVAHRKQADDLQGGVDSLRQELNKLKMEHALALERLRDALAAGQPPAKKQFFRSVAASGVDLKLSGPQVFSWSPKGLARPTGLRNSANMCHVNAIAQLLRHNVLLRSTMTKSSVLAAQRRKKPPNASEKLSRKAARNAAQSGSSRAETLSEALGSLFGAMENTKTNGKPGFIKPDLITRFLQGVNGAVKGEQADAAETMSAILDGVAQDSERPSQENGLKSAIEGVVGEMTVGHRCDCDWSCTKSEPFKILNLPMTPLERPAAGKQERSGGGSESAGGEEDEKANDEQGRREDGGVSVVDLLNKVFEGESGCDPCSYCTEHENRASHKRGNSSALTRCPETLFLSLGRVAFVGGEVVKLTQKVDIPLTLSIEQPAAEKVMYDLDGVVHHRDRGSAEAGHYYTFVRSGPESWRKFDDSSVTEASASEVLDEKAYIMSYSRRR